jgi:hypothetical protein
VPGVREADTQKDLAAQLEWYKDAQSEIDSFANVTPLPLEHATKCIRTRGQLLQQAGSPSWAIHP